MRPQRGHRALELAFALAACSLAWRLLGGGQSSKGAGGSGGTAASFFGGSSLISAGAGANAGFGFAASRQGPPQQQAGVEASSSASRVPRQAQGDSVEPEDGLVHINSKEEFQANLDSAVTVAMFSSPMCGPCVLVEPKIIEMQAEFKSAGLKVLKLNLTPGKNVKELRPLFSELEVKALPTFLVYKAGEVRGRLSGTKHEELRELIEGLI